MVFAGIAVILILAFFLSVDFERDFSPDNLIGTLFYFFLAGGSAFLAGWEEKTVLSRTQDRMEFYRSLFGVSFLTKSIPFDDVTAITSVRDSGGLVEESEREKTGEPRLIRYGPPSMYQVFVETVDERVLLGQAPERKEIEDIASLIAQFLETPFIRSDHG
jgi:hypothetical protein